MYNQPPKSSTPLTPHDKGGWQGGRFLAPLVRGVEGKDKGSPSLLSSPLVRGVAGGLWKLRDGRSYWTFDASLVRKTFPHCSSRFGSRFIGEFIGLLVG